MVCVKSLHLELNRILLLIVGLWPYERSKLNRLHLIFFYGILLTFIIFQCTTFITSKYTMQSFIEILSAITFFLIFKINYNIFCFNMGTIKHLLDILQQNYDELKDESEVCIIEKYGVIASRFTDVLTLLCTCFLSIIVLCQLWPCIFDVTLSANISRPHAITLIKMEYFIDQEKYSNLITLHLNVAIGIGAVVMLATGTMTITFFVYTCGMFKIASYRLEQSIKITTSEKNCTKKILIYRQIIYAINMHRNAIAFINTFMSKLSMSYLSLMLVGLICLTTNLFREISSGASIEKFILPVIFSFIVYLYIYLANGCSQQVMDCCDNVYTTAYNIQWYLAPIRTQKIVLFLLQRGCKPFIIYAGGMFVGSLENAAMMTSASLSYSAVLYSTY